MKKEIELMTLRRVHLYKLLGDFPCVDAGCLL